MKTNTHSKFNKAIKCRHFSFKLSDLCNKVCVFHYKIFCYCCCNLGQISCSIFKINTKIENKIKSIYIRFNNSVHFKTNIIKLNLISFFISFKNFTNQVNYLKKYRKRNKIKYEKSYKGHNKN
jgi:hypothetical protein